MAPGVMAAFLTIFMSHIFLRRDNLKSDKIARVFDVANGDYLQFGVSDVFAKSKQGSCRKGPEVHGGPCRLPGCASISDVSLLVLSDKKYYMVFSEV
jgi:hypothetical protein